MLNMIRADLYRLVHQKSTWVLLIVSTAVMLFTSFTLGFILGDADWLVVMLKDYDELCRELGMANPFTVYKELFSVQCGDSLDFVTQSLTRDLAIAMAIFVYVFAEAPRTGGYIKNLAYQHDRKTRFFSNALMSFIYACMLTFASAAVSFLLSLLFFKKVDMSLFGMFLLYLLLFAMLLCTVGLFIMCVSDLMKRPTGGLLLSIAYMSMGAAAFYQVMNTLVQSVSGDGFFVEFITPLGNMSLLTLGKWDTYLAAVLVVVLYFVLTALTETVFLKNKELI